MVKKKILNRFGGILIIEVDFYLVDYINYMVFIGFLRVNGNRDFEKKKKEKQRDEICKINFG